MELGTLFGDFVVMLIKTRGFAYFVETLVVVVLVQLLKKLLPKLKIDLTGGFDPCVAAPFVFALPVVAVKMLLVDKTGWSGLLTDALLVDAVSVGATSVTVYKLFAASDKESLKNLMKDNVFSLVYSQIFLFSDARERLIDKSVKAVDFVAGIKELATELAGVYGEDADKDGTALKLGERMAELFPSLHFSEKGIAEMDRIFQLFFAPDQTAPEEKGGAGRAGAEGATALFLRLKSTSGHRRSRRKRRQAREVEL